MGISEELKINLIADVENVCEVSLDKETKIALMRCFEITIGVEILNIPDVRRSVTITLPLDIAETLQGLVDGCNGSSEDEDFSREMRIVLKKLDKAISKHYA